MIDLIRGERYFMKFTSLSLLTLFCLSLSLPAVAQPKSTGVGKNGIYGRNTTDPEGTETPKNTVVPTAKPGQPAKAPLSEEQKRLLEKYPLSITGKTTTNQKAHLALLQGIQLYNHTVGIFSAANEITSTYSQGESELSVSQKGIITARLQPSDLLLYGPENAFIAVRLRALQDADRTISRAISSFGQAASLAPSLSVVPKWLRVSRDTQKAIRYHIRFYQLSLKAIDMGYTQKELSYMAKRWSAPHDIEPEDTLTTRVNTTLFEKLRKGSTSSEESTVERPSLDGFIESLPKLDFEVLK